MTQPLLQELDLDQIQRLKSTPPHLCRKASNCGGWRQVIQTSQRKLHPETEQLVVQASCWYRKDVARITVASLLEHRMWH